MNFAIIQFPGSNCERETKLALLRSGINPIEFLWNDPIQKLEHMDAYIIVGGFSYEDRSRAGIIAALDPVMQEIRRQSEKGKPVLGICNGAQILVETGLVPGLRNNQLAMALTDNKRMVDGKIYGTGFYNAWVHISLSSQAKKNVFTRNISENTVLSVPVAHAQGRFVMPESLLDKIETEGLIGFQYCDEKGKLEAHFPINPNGSMRNIAAVVNQSGNVMAMMPHPERTLVGDVIFASMRDSIRDNNRCSLLPLNYSTTLQSPLPYQKKPQAHRLMVQLIITDNQALTVQNTLQKLGIFVEVTLRVYWEIDRCDPKTLEKIKNSGLLFNDRKEFIVNHTEPQDEDALSFLVISKEDLIGQEKKQRLEDHCALDEVPDITHGILWIFKSKDGKIKSLKDAILNTHIISNPFSFTCYDYENTN